MLYQCLTHVLASMRTTVSSHTLSNFECFILIAAGFRNRNSDGDDTSCMEEGGVRPWSLGGRGSRVACAVEM